MPRIDDLFDQLQDVAMLSKIDLRSDYHPTTSLRPHLRLDANL